MKFITSFLLVFVIISSLFILDCNLSRNNPSHLLNGDNLHLSNSLPNSEWCKSGSSWNSSFNNYYGYDSLKWEVLGYEKYGKYKGLCHVIASADDGQKSIVLEYWFDEKGEKNYFKTEHNGEIIIHEF